MNLEPTGAGKDAKPEFSVKPVAKPLPENKPMPQPTTSAPPKQIAPKPAPNPLDQFAPPEVKKKKQEDQQASAEWDPY